MPIIRKDLVLWAVNFINNTSATLLCALCFVACSTRLWTTSLLYIVDRTFLLTKGKLHKVFSVELALGFTLWEADKWIVHLDRQDNRWWCVMQSGWWLLNFASDKLHFSRTDQLCTRRCCQWMTLLSRLHWTCTGQARLPSRRFTHHFSI